MDISRSLKTGKKVYVVVRWEIEQTFSAVAKSQLIFDEGEDQENILFKTFAVRWSKDDTDFPMGIVEGVGTKSSMRKLELDLARGAAEISFAEKDVNEILTGRPKSKAHPYGEDFINPLKATRPSIKREHDNLLPVYTANENRISSQKHDSSSFVSHDDAKNDEKIRPSNCLDNNNLLQEFESPNENQDILQDDHSSLNGDNVGDAGCCQNNTQFYSQRRRPEGYENPYDMISKKNENILSLEKQVRELKAENKVLKGRLKRSVSTVSGVETERLEFRPNFFIDKPFLELTKLSYLTQPSLFFRKLIFESGLFSLDEIAASSLSGKSSPLTRDQRRPPLDPARFAAIKDFTVQTCNLKHGSAEMLLFERKIKSICSDARKKQKRSNPHE